MSLVSDSCLRLVIYQMCVAIEHFSRTKWKWDTWLNCEFAVRKKVKALLSCNPFSCWFPSKMARVSPLAFLTTKKIAYIRLLCPLYLVLTLLLYLCPIYFHALPLEFVNLVSLFPCLHCKNIPIKVIRTFWIKLKFKILSKKCEVSIFIEPSTWICFWEVNCLRQELVPSY